MDRFHKPLEISSGMLYLQAGEITREGLLSPLNFFEEKHDMDTEKRVRDIMAPIEEYETIPVDGKLGDALAVLKRKHEAQKGDAGGVGHRTFFVTNSRGKIIGKLSIYDLIRGLVPESSKKPDHSRIFYSVLSGRAMEVSDEVGDFQRRFQWIRSSFFDLVKQEAGKSIGEIMSPVHPLLAEDDTINQAIYVMFKEGIRQPLVSRKDRIVGVVDFNHIFEELIRIVGPDCGVRW
ncbi:MAG: hypothetical protein DRH20_06480 [Deltaproteobacteria bacterium]|nr:MAG: hypothetical protein DRH20_06480 [Deltaproteobacteria bacterium]